MTSVLSVTSYYMKNSSCTKTFFCLPDYQVTDYIWLGIPSQSIGIHEWELAAYLTSHVLRQILLYHGKNRARSWSLSCKAQNHERCFDIMRYNHSTKFELSTWHFLLLSWSPCSHIFWWTIQIQAIINCQDCHQDSRYVFLLQIHSSCIFPNVQYWIKMIPIEHLQYLWGPKNSAFVLYQS